MRNVFIYYVFITNLLRKIYKRTWAVKINSYKLINKKYVVAIFFIGTVKTGGLVSLFFIFSISLYVIYFFFKLKMEYEKSEYYEVAIV